MDLVGTQDRSHDSDERESEERIPLNYLAFDFHSVFSVIHETSHPTSYCVKLPPSPASSLAHVATDCIVHAAVVVPDSMLAVN